MSIWCNKIAIIGYILLGISFLFGVILMFEDPFYFPGFNKNTCFVVNYTLYNNSCPANTCLSTSNVITNQSECWSAYISEYYNTNNTTIYFNITTDKYCTENTTITNVYNYNDTTCWVNKTNADDIKFNFYHMDFRSIISISIPSIIIWGIGVISFLICIVINIIRYYNTRNKSNYLEFTDPHMSHSYTPNSYTIF